jgi:hypothetical protein
MHGETVKLKVLLLRLFGCLYYCVNDARSHKHRIQKADTYFIGLV